MPWTSAHTSWLKDTGTRLTANSGQTVEIWELQHQNDQTILSAWAKHFRNHYCFDTEIDSLINGTGYSRATYLDSIKFPDQKGKPGPSIRAGDFGEILVADFLEYLLKFSVPRTRYGDKTVRNESIKGCDVIGFRFLEDGKVSPKDILAIFESKAQFSGRKPKPRLQDAINDSAKDHVRKAESLNAIKQRLKARRDTDCAKKIERFQNEADLPYTHLYGAVALFEGSLFNNTVATSTTTAKHPNGSSLRLYVIKGAQMMQLVHALYKRASDEA